MRKLLIPRYKQIQYLSDQDRENISFSQGTVRFNGLSYIQNKLSIPLGIEDINYYHHPIGLLPLRKKIVNTLKKKHEIQIDALNVMITHGSVGGINAICLALLDHGDDVLLVEPYYPSYVNIVGISRANVVIAPKVYVFSNHEWKFDFEKLKNAKTAKTKLLIISNPNNPTGYILTKEELELPVDWCEKENIYLIVDEVYDNYLYGQELVSSTKYAISKPHVLRVGSFSKDYALSGWRIGFIIGSFPNIQHLIMTQDAMLTCPSVIGQYIVLTALNNQKSFIPMLREIEKSKQIALDYAKQLEDLGTIEYYLPNAGIFLFLKMQIPDTTTLVNDLLAKAQVAMVPGIDFGENYRSYVRICFARSPKIVAIGMKRLFEYFRSFKISTG